MWGVLIQNTKKNETKVGSLAFYMVFSSYHIWLRFNEWVITLNCCEVWHYGVDY